jgi:hypothetical protein
VQSVLEKNQTAAAIEVKVAAANLLAKSTDAVISAFGKAGRTTNKTQPMR